MSVSSIRIEASLQHPLVQMAQARHCSKSQIINEALRAYLQKRSLEKQYWEDTLEALEDIRMGRVVEGDKVHAWLESWGTDNEAEAPS
jgi:predicted transcriptional regulator